MTKTLDVQTIRKDFPNLHLSVYDKPLVYLDNAATTFKPQSVIDAIRDHYTVETSNVHRGVHYLSERATADYEAVRETVRSLINAQKTEEIIFTRGTTDAINLVAQSYGRANFQKGDEIIISTMEHHSNIVPWQMLCEEKGCVLKVVPINDDGELIFDQFAQFISSKTKLIAITYVSNSIGTINPIKDIIAEAKKHNVPVLIDAAQAVNHFSIDVQDLDCDFLVFSGHKLYGPTGVGVLYGKEDLLNAMPPVQGGGDMIASVTFKKTTYNHLPYKFEAGTPNIAGVIGMGAGIKYFQSLGVENVMAYEKELLQYGTETLVKIPGLKIIGTAKNKASIISFTLDNIHSHDIGTIVDREGVAIRTGHHCTMPLMHRFKVDATSRASMSFYNTKEEIDQLAKAIEKAKEIFA